MANLGNKHFKYRIMVIDLKICGITNLSSIKIAAQKNIHSLGFASKNLYGPNTCNDKKIKKLIKECDYYNINSVLLSRHYTLKELIQQINFTKPKTISCSYFFRKKDFETLKFIFTKLKIGIAVNATNFDGEYFKSIKSLVSVFYYDLNIYTKYNITTLSPNRCLKQIQFLKNLNLPVYIGGGININNAKKIIKQIKPNGLDVSRSLKDKNNNISSIKLNKLQINLSAA